MSINPAVVTRGYGSFGTAALVVTRGYSVGVVVGYDLSGIAATLSTIYQMIADQRAGTVKFAGGYETWLPVPQGYFDAKLSVGGSLVPTTTNVVRAALTALRVTFDLIAAAPGTTAENAITLNSAAVPGSPLAAGRSGAIGPVVYGPLSVQATSYDLSGIASAQATANQMLADQQNAVRNFEKPFNAVVAVGGQAVSTTMATVRSLLALLRAAFDLLAQ